MPGRAPLPAVRLVWWCIGVGERAISRGGAPEELRRTRLGAGLSTESTLSTRRASHPRKQRCLGSFGGWLVSGTEAVGIAGVRLVVRAARVAIAAVLALLNRDEVDHQC